MTGDRCECGKYIYDNKEEAERSAELLRSEHGHLQPYKCRKDGPWHLTGGRDKPEYKSRARKRYLDNVRADPSRLQKFIENRREKIERRRQRKQQRESSD